MQIRVFPSLEALSQAAAETVGERCRLAASERGRFSLALSGGSTPIRTYEILVEKPLPWSAVRVFWSDERYVPVDDPGSNEGAARRAWLDRVPIPPENLHGMYVPGGVETAAQAYDRKLARLFPEDEGFDVCLLGIGADGHTASLFAGSSALGESERRAMAVEGPGRFKDRITVTAPMLARSELVVFLAAGVEKARAVAAVVQPPEGDPLPAEIVAAQSREAWLWVDEDAASALSGTPEAARSGV